MNQSLDDFYNFLNGASVFGAWACAYFFFRFWKKTEDRLFWWFAVSFWLMSVERFALLFFSTPLTEDHSLIYGLRLIAFLLIIVAVVNKNRKSQNT